MSTLFEDVNDFITNRENTVYVEIADEPDFKKLRMEISNLEDYLLNLIPSEEKETFHRYNELNAMRYGRMQDQVYKKGFADGGRIMRKLP